MKQATDPLKQRSPVPLIIVADDDKSVRMVIAQALTRQGYHVQTTATAAGYVGPIPGQQRRITYH